MDLFFENVQTEMQHQIDGVVNKMTNKFCGAFLDEGAQNQVGNNNQQIPVEVELKIDRKLDRDDFKPFKKNSDSKFQMAFQQIELLNEHLQSTLVLITQYMKSLLE